jgi:hypothetical protein
MTNDTALPISIRDVSPCPDAVRLTGTRPDGLPDGVHTGGAWLLPDGNVWKPLDGRPYANCDHHYPTREAECLEVMADRPMFPRNWWIIHRNGRSWLVRNKAWVFGQCPELSLKDLKLEQLLQVEQGVRDLNQHHWEIGDNISIALDEAYNLFILDLSCAGEIHGTGIYVADDEWRILRFFDDVGATRLRRRREKARHVVSDLKFIVEHRGFHHVYASYNRPISSMWASIPGAVYVHEDHPNWEDATPHTWVITQQPLDTDMIARYELSWGWSPIHTTQHNQNNQTLTNTEKEQ